MYHISLPFLALSFPYSAVNNPHWVIPSCSSSTGSGCQRGVCAGSPGRCHAVVSPAMGSGQKHHWVLPAGAQSWWQGHRSGWGGEGWAMLSWCAAYSWMDASPLHSAALETGNFPFTPCFSSVKLLKIKLCMDSRNAYSERSDGISNYFPQIP